MRIAFVYDRVNKFGGAERVLLTLHEIWPQAPLFTAVYHKESARWADVFEVHPSWLNSIPFFSKHHEFIPFLTSRAMESFNFDDFDVVISITSADAKDIIIKPHTLHICYCLTPSRYLWSGYRQYSEQPGFGLLNPLARAVLKILGKSMRRHDMIAAKRPDQYISISKAVQRRCQAYYGVKSSVIYPSVDPVVYTKGIGKKEDFYLIVSRLVPYKGIEYSIEACNTLGKKLIIIGNGVDKKRLQARAGSTIHFIQTHLTEKELGWYYESCKAVISPAEEDFGLVVLEAQMHGTPVIALGRGGASETIIPGKTGELYQEPRSTALAQCIKHFEMRSYNRQDCQEHAKTFRKEHFKKVMKKHVESAWLTFAKTNL